MASPLEQQQQEQISQQWNPPSGTAFAEGGLPLWTAGTINSRSLRNPFVKSFGLRHKATMDWGMRSRARTRRHWDKYWHQVETGEKYGFDNLYETGNSGTGAGISAGVSTDVGAGGSGGPGGDNSKAPGEETTISSSPHTKSYTNGTSSSSLNCTQNSNLDADSRSNSTDKSYPTAAATKDNGLARAETELSLSPDMIVPLPGDNDGPGSLFFSQLLNHYQKSPPSHDPSTYFSSTRTDHNTTTHNTTATFRQYYQINWEFYKPGGPIILWLPGESPLHSLFLRRGLAYELANATTGLLVALEHRFYGNSIPRFQDSPASQMDGPLIFDAVREKQEQSPLSTPADLMSDPEYPPRHMTAPAPPTEDEEDGEVERAGGVCMEARPLVSSTSPNSGPTKLNHQIGVDKASRARIKGSKHRQFKGEKQQQHNPPPPPPHNQTDNVHDGNSANNNSTSEGEKEGLPLDLLKFLNVDQSIEDIARFMDLFPTLQPKLFPTGEGDPVTASAPPPNLRWILAGCSYGGNLAAWTRQRYPSKVFAAFASSAPVRSALDFFEYSTSQIDILGDKCSTQLGLARDFLDGALQMTDGFMQQMAAVDLEIKQQTAAGIVSPTDSTRQEQGRTVAATGDFDNFSPPTVTATDPMPVVGDDDKARRQAAKLRVLSWFSPDFAREYAAEGEEFHAAGWVWWTVASAVQYNAVVTPITVQPAQTAVDILCGAMGLAEDDDPAGSGSSTNNNSSNSSTLGQLRSLQYTKALASWFKDQQYFTPTKQEDLQPSDLDSTSVQNLAGMAWLWQTCSELGYLQTAHPSTCCCPSLAGSSSPFQFLDNFEDIKIGNSPTTVIEQGSNATCPLIPDSVDSTFYSSTFFPPPEGSSSYQLTAATNESSLPSFSAGSTPGGSMPAGSTCLPCRCYANEAQRSESVFSRLLTLEGAWQECQFYFGSTHPLARNPITKTSSSPPTTSSSPSSLSSSFKETTVVEAPNLNPAGALEEVDVSATTITTNRQREQSPRGRGPSDDTQRCAGANPRTGATQLNEKRDDVLLMGYPDVETNVNTKFHGWEIAQDPCYPSGSSGHGIETGGEYTDSNNNNPLSNEIHSGSSSTTTSTPASGRTVTSAQDPVAADAAASTLRRPKIAEKGIVEQKCGKETGDGSPRIASELDDWLIDHPGGRYYFTNGEKDPWKELTLASSKALEFLSRPKVESETGNNSKGGDVGTGGKKRGRKRASSKQDSAAQAPPLESADSMESAPLASFEIGHGGGSIGGPVVPQDTVKYIEDEDLVVVEESSLAPAPTAETTSTSTQQRDSRDRYKAKHHRRHHRHRHRHHRHHSRKHHHHHHHHKHKHHPKRPVCTRSPVDPCQRGPPPALMSGGRRDIGTALSQPELPDQDEDVAGENDGYGSDGSTVIIVEVDEHERKDDEEKEEDEGRTIEGNDNNRIGEDEYGDRTVIRIISDASHCQDILYESSDHNSAKLRAEREHVLRTFVRWIEIDNRRVQRALERRQQQ
ncbi:hypothetical protein KI688_004649 [Linnemannia hyalina]|uniref:Uncharacterized protein n=1 Tax=Linnemannia hyalina TaxID=64524 RepID=A0A9P7XLT3_9FUNG|nr:hypothetical protein KI688_004649 [Linnemannia hyalina]